ncbi:hypothetical protein BCR37DRAFT_393272 [Protomyces lactucae-debilis]|uniref:Uncharacterized protein n=1 Tax=Protomyces lactucae-debilis TaxID=2754530 RepID=A0A1Y2FBW9_PROLT|nr:uncharacterized protein BCR37DRAFT_393272 [Protomyces lactucae-debilis]ORY81403.1 hypothetical protein BCR37DRAFT_393272 [Protomyces lactucae-debilis]
MRPEEVFYAPSVVSVGGRHRQPSVTDSSILSPTPTCVSRFTPITTPNLSHGFHSYSLTAPSMERKGSNSSNVSSTTLHETHAATWSHSSPFKGLLSKKSLLHIKTIALPTSRAKHDLHLDTNSGMDFSTFMKSAPSSPTSQTTPVVAQLSAQDRKLAKELAKTEKLREVVRLRNEKIDRQEAKKQASRLAKVKPFQQSTGLAAVPA